MTDDFDETPAIRLPRALTDTPPGPELVREPALNGWPQERAAPPPTKAEKLNALRPRLIGPFIKGEDGRIDCTFDHPELGKIPFTADPQDEEEHGRLIFEIATAFVTNSR